MSRLALPVVADIISPVPPFRVVNTAPLMLRLPQVVCHIEVPYDVIFTGLPSNVRAAVELPIVVGPLPAPILMFRAFPPVVQVLVAAALKFSAPALFKASVPLPVVLNVNGPPATVIVKPPVPGPVIDLAVVPEKTKLFPSVVTPVTPSVPAIQPTGAIGEYVAGRSVRRVSLNFPWAA